MPTAQTITTLQSQFEATTVDSAKVMAYLCALPDYLKLGIQFGYSTHVCHCLDYIDGIDFWLRRYLIGHPATLRNMFQWIRSFLAYNECEARELIPVALDTIQERILDNEWYELMPRYRKARKRIQKTFQL